MKRTILVAFLTLALVAVSGLATIVEADLSKTDFALFDGTNPANAPGSGAICIGSKDFKADKQFIYHVAVTNHHSGAGHVRITYADGDFVNYQIAAGGSFSLSQAAGGTGGADKGVRVSNGGSAAVIVGAMSAVGLEPVCVSCGGADADRFCDTLIPD